MLTKLPKSTEYLLSLNQLINAPPWKMYNHHNMITASNLIVTQNEFIWFSWILFSLQELYELAVSTLLPFDNILIKFSLFLVFFFSLTNSKWIFLCLSLCVCLCWCACACAVSIWDRYRAPVSFFLSTPEDECGGSSAGGETYGCLHEGGTRGGG